MSAYQNVHGLNGCLKASYQEILQSEKDVQITCCQISERSANSKTVPRGFKASRYMVGKAS